MAGAVVDTAIVIGVTLTTTLLLLLISGQLHDTTAGDLISQSSAPVLVPFSAGQPTPEQSALVHPTPSPRFTTSAASPSPVAAPTEAENAANAPDDATIQAAIDKKLQADPDLSNVTATVSAGKVVVVGSVPSDELKAKAEKLLRTVKGVQKVDNQIAVLSGN